MNDFINLERKISEIKISQEAWNFKQENKTTELQMVLKLF